MEFKKFSHNWNLSCFYRLFLRNIVAILCLFFSAASAASCCTHSSYRYYKIFAFTTNVKYQKWWKINKRMSNKNEVWEKGGKKSAHLHQVYFYECSKCACVNKTWCFQASDYTRCIHNCSQRTHTHSQLQSVSRRLNGVKIVFLFILSRKHVNLLSNFHKAGPDRIVLQLCCFLRRHRLLFNYPDFVISFS